VFLASSAKVQELRLTNLTARINRAKD
jgi:hypothetical protein